MKNTLTTIFWIIFTLIFVPSLQAQYVLKASDVEMEGNTLVNYTNRVEKNIVIPSSIGGVTVKAIGCKAFYAKGLRSVRIPSSVTAIESPAFHLNVGAFRSNDLSTVVFEANSRLRTIGDFAFSENYLSRISIPATVTNIGSSAFARNSLNVVVFSPHAELKEIGGNAFANNRLTRIGIPASVKNLGVKAFYENQLLLVSFASHSQLQSVGGRAFDNNSRLQKIALPVVSGKEWVNEFYRERVTHIESGMQGVVLRQKR